MMALMFLKPIEKTDIKRPCTLMVASLNLHRRVLSFARITLLQLQLIIVKELFEG